MLRLTYLFLHSEYSISRRMVIEKLDKFLATVDYGRDLADELLY